MLNLPYPGDGTDLDLITLWTTEPKGKRANTMSEQKHTPGPWYALGLDFAKTKVWEVVAGPKSDTVVELSLFSENAGADAKLIAAAPELLAALEVAVEYFDRNDIDCVAHDDAKAAIKKAKGE
tara:strand:- start:1415 stop:1783 length:369 start_codon:yes stop_codon:yes gene_type:complete